MLPDPFDLWKAIYFSIQRDNPSGNLHLGPKYTEASYLLTGISCKQRKNWKHSLIRYCCGTQIKHLSPVLLLTPCIALVTPTLPFAEKWLGPGMVAPCDGFVYLCSHFCSVAADKRAMFPCSSTGQDSGSCPLQTPAQGHRLQTCFQYHTLSIIRETKPFASRKIKVAPYCQV